MHKIIQIKGNSECSSGAGANGYHAASSHRKSARNGNFRESNGLVGGHENDSDSDDETDISSLRSRTRSNAKKRQKWRKVLANFLALSVPILFPTIHMYIFHHLWGHLKTPVDRKQCTCSCWDSIFKGPYESGIGGFKHAYFNSDGNTLKMWVITVIGVLFLYEAFKRLFLLLMSKKLRWTMGILFLSSLHSHYYAWWGHWNYWNDDFYHMWYHQVFFTVTELISSVMVLSYLDVRRPVEPIPMLVVCSIAVFHTFCSGWDQFVFTVVQGQGQLHQVLRDVTLMSTDIIHAIVSFYEVRAYAVRKGHSLLSILLQRTHLVIVSFIIMGMYVAVLFFPS